MARSEASDPDDPDGLMNDQEMPTADGQMASNTSEEVVPPRAGRDEDPRWGADTGDGGPGGLMSDIPAPGVTPEGRDSTVGDEPTESGRGPEELDDVTDDGTAGDGTLGDGEPGGDVLDEILENHGSGGGSDGVGDGLSTGDALDLPATGDEEVFQQPEELDADAMGRPEHGSMNDDDQGMENAGRNAGV